MLENGVFEKFKYTAWVAGTLKGEMSARGSVCECLVMNVIDEDSVRLRTVWVIK